MGVNLCRKTPPCLWVPQKSPKTNGCRAPALFFFLSPCASPCQESGRCWRRRWAVERLCVSGSRKRVRRPIDAARPPCSSFFHLALRLVRSGGDVGGEDGTHLALCVVKVENGGESLGGEAGRADGAAGTSERARDPEENRREEVRTTAKIISDSW